MATSQTSKSAKVRSRLDHPVIDADGHIVELTPVYIDYIRDVAGNDIAQRYTQPRDRKFYSPHHRGLGVTSTAERRENWIPIGGWGAPHSTLDRATAMAPKLLNARLEELGMDFVILYPSQGLGAAGIGDDELRRAACRAYNTYAADLVRDYPTTMAPVAAIPMHTPQEAVEELEYAVNVLGFRAAVFQGSIRRPIESFRREHPELADMVARLELFALDSDYDYDPVWAKCVELRVPAGFHSMVQAFGTDSITNYSFNHIGLLANSHAAVCKALFLGGVTRRFPEMRFAFLEGGVSWACNMYSDLIGHWEKRGAAVLSGLDPNNLDREQMVRLLTDYGDDRTRGKVEQLQEFFNRPSARPEELDDFAASGIERAEDIRDRFIPSFYFGCEADDPMSATAYNRNANPMGATIRTIFGSDIGHWDVPVMNKVVAEAYELVEKGAITEEDFRDFIFVNPVRLHAGMNPDFFKGTAVQAEADKLVKAGL